MKKIIYVPAYMLLNNVDGTLDFAYNNCEVDDEEYPYEMADMIRDKLEYKMNNSVNLIGLNQFMIKFAKTFEEQMGSRNYAEMIEALMRTTVQFADEFRNRFVDQKNLTMFPIVEYAALMTYNKSTDDYHVLYLDRNKNNDDSTDKKFYDLIDKCPIRSLHGVISDLAADLLDNVILKNDLLDKNPEPGTYLSIDAEELPNTHVDIDAFVLIPIVNMLDSELPLCILQQQPRAN